MPEQPPVPSPLVRRFNLAVEALDGFTAGRFDRVTSVPVLLRHAERVLGPGSVYVILFKQSAKDLGYFPAVNVLETQTK